MTRLACLICLIPLFLLSGCSPVEHAVIADEPMTWTVSNDRSLIELRYVRDPGYFVTICSNGVLDHLEKLGKREVIVEHRVWGEWPWSTALYGFNPERVEGRTVLYCQDRHLVSGSRGSHTGRHPLERHLRRR